MKSLPALVLLAACRSGQEEPLRLQATIAFPPRDTIRFALPATTHRCNGGRSLLLEAISPQGRGVLVRLHFADSLMVGPYPITALADSMTVPGAQVAVRYLNRDVAHGFTIDSGSVEVQRGAGTITTHIRGTGLENAIRTPTWIDFQEVPLAPPTDTVPCRYEP